MDDGGIIVGFRRITGLQRLLSVPSGVVPPIRPVDGEIDGEDRVVLLFPVLLHGIPPPGLAEAVVSQPHGHVIIEGGTHKPLARTDLPTKRAVTLLRLPHRTHPALPSSLQEGPLPLHTAAAARHGASPDDVVPPVAGDVFPAGEREG